MLTKDKYNIFDPGDQGGTYSSQPLAMSVGIAVFKEIIKDDLINNAKIQGEYLVERLKDIQSKYNLKDIRGMGLLIAFDLPEAKGPEFVKACLGEGLILNSPGPSVIRLMPPLIVTKDENDEMMRKLSKAFDRILIQ